MNGEQIRKKRMALGWNQKQLAHKLGMRYSSEVSRWESGQKIPCRERMQELERVLNPVDTRSHLERIYHSLSPTERFWMLRRILRDA